MKLENSLFEGVFSVTIEGECADGARYSYQAFCLRELLRSMSADELVEFSGQDGQGVAVSGEEVLAGDVYLARDGGGYRLVIPKDSHRRRWCKQITEVIRTGEGGS